MIDRKRLMSIYPQVLEWLEKRELESPQRKCIRVRELEQECEVVCYFDEAPMLEMLWRDGNIDLLLFPVCKKCNTEGDSVWLDPRLPIDYQIYDDSCSSCGEKDDFYDLFLAHRSYCLKPRKERRNYE